MNQAIKNRSKLVSLLLLVMVIMTLAGGTAVSGQTPEPTSVTIAGSLQSELGCPGDWQPDCAASSLVYDAEDTVWQNDISVPEGNWEYKAALNGSWDENYGLNAQPNGANIPLNLATDQDVKFYYDHGTHWITDNFNSVIATAAGSFQSELGCPGDWQPDCLRSWLQDPDGDGVYMFTTNAIPAGGYEFKAALNEGWNISYPGSNVPFSVPSAGSQVTIAFDSATTEVTVNVEAAVVPPEIAALATAPLRNPNQDEVFYFVMPDRFDNGDPANNTGFIPGDRLANGFDPTDKGFYHGGDLAGLIDQLDYLQSLGTTAIWMTPVFENNPVQGEEPDISAGYHGYWPVDFSQIDPHMGTNAELEYLIDQAHARGMKVFFDIITNHTADIIDYEQGQYNYISKADQAFRDSDGVIFDDRHYVGTGTFPELDPAVSFPYTPYNRQDAPVKVPDWLNNTIYYHNRGNSTFSGESSLYGDFYGLDDMFTEHPDVVDGMIDIYKDWIEFYEIDGYRIDTVKHVNLEFWQEFVPQIMAKAQAEGHNEFFVFGEVYSGDPVLLSQYTSRADFPAVLDFRFQGQVRSYASANGSADSLRTLFADDDYFTDANSNVYALPTFTGNHDLGRFGWFLNADNNYGLSDEAMVARSELATGLMFFARGIPVIYYGDEQGFTGTGGDKDARQDMMPSQVDEYNANDLIGTDATTADANFDQTHPLYMAYSNFAAILEDPANIGLRTGAQLHRYAANGQGIYAFSRIDREEKVEYLAAFNNATSEQTSSFVIDSLGTSFTPLYPAGAPAVSSDATGLVSVTVPATSFVLYKADAPISASPYAPIPAFNTLANDQEVLIQTQVMDGNEVQGRIEVGVALDNAQYAEVTFAVRKSGTTDYTAVGVDDNSPYRVFFSLDDVPGGFNEGDKLDFVAVVRDISGNLSYAEVSNITPIFPIPQPPGGSPYAVVHYLRDAADYDNWGLYAWGDIDETVTWDTPKPFIGEDEYGRFAWLTLAENASNVGFIVKDVNGVKDPDNSPDRFFNPNETPQIWLKQNDPMVYTSQAAVQGYVTIHYHRDDAAYADWGLHLWGDAIDPSEVTDWGSPKPPAGFDDFGAYWTVLVQDVTQPVNFIIHNGDTKDPGPNQSFIPEEMATVWVMSGNETVYPQRGAAEGYAIIRYHRADGDYGDYSSDNFIDFWGLHTWNNTADPGWTTPRKPDIQDSFGIGFTVELIDPTQNFNYILHRGDTKDPGNDQILKVGKWGYEVWQLEGQGPDHPDEPHYVLPILTAGVPGNINQQSAYWVDKNTILWSGAGDPNLVYQLNYAADGGLSLSAGGILGGSSLTLVPGVVSSEVKAKFPNLADLPGLKITAVDMAQVPEILKGQIAVSSVDQNGFLVDATGLQIPGVLDDLYTYDGELGVTWHGGVPTISVWAPTAKSVTLHLYDDSDTATTGTTVPMTLDPAYGVWSATGDGRWKDKYYLFEVEIYVHSTGQVEHNMVTDPYSLSLSMNSTRSQIVNLQDPALKPDGWDTLQKPELAAPEDISIYEIHIRDFSVNDPSVPDDLKGTFKAFTLDNSYGVQHLRKLQEAGLTHLHLLPAFDIATINEDKNTWQEADWGDLALYKPDSDQQQALITQYENLDGFNWGYDPFHYTTPEGSYSTDPDSEARILEFREMVQALNEDDNLRVVMDVVYNHTNAHGQDPYSVLDQVVPGYYHRLNDVGEVENSTCCSNTATEHNMMEKLMIDSLVVWAKEYKVDAFRFDLMGHHSLQNMRNVQDALHAIDPTIYIYGEGWNFGEVANDALFVQATQANLGGTGIGSFSDRLRDAVRGGSPFDSGDSLVINQGFANGLYYDPNDLSGTPDAQPEPDTVTIAGDLQSELGCGGDWQPDCAITHLAFDADDQVWQQTFSIPGGAYEYKAALNNSWDESYGGPGGSNILLNLGTETAVKFYFSRATNWVTDDVNTPIAVAAGSFQNSLGCPGDWSPDCLRSWLQDPDDDGTYEFTTSTLPAGSYEAKVAIDESWDVNYGQDGVPNGANIPFTVEVGQSVTFSYDGTSHVMSISTANNNALANLMHLTDLVRLGMAGNLADYTFVDSSNNLVTGAQIDYNGQPAGYTDDPQEDITYISKHDNQTLYDNNTYKMPLTASMEERVRAQNVGFSTVLLGQGVPFMQAGSDLLRSKAFDRDSYNSGDWFNKLDFTYQDSNYAIGLPVAGKNQENWYLIGPRLADPALNPDPDSIAFSTALYQELLALRASTPLFHLQTFAEVQERVAFHNTGSAQLPGLIVMSIVDAGLAQDLDVHYDSIVVLVNANDEAQTITVDDLAGMGYTLHPIHVNSVDDLVKTSSYAEDGTFTVPGRTTAVFVQYGNPSDMIQDLIDWVQDLINQGEINPGNGRSLIAMLETAQRHLDDGRPLQAVHSLNNFIKQVGIYSGSKLSPDIAAQLIEEAQFIITVIETGM
ncbi:MAG: pullulanase-type alpha-1,6-glucosidase [Candidatus Promineifilaceae bacterium]